MSSSEHLLKMNGESGGGGDEARQSEANGKSLANNDCIDLTYLH